MILSGCRAKQTINYGMPLDPATPLQQKAVPAGTVLFEAGRAPEMICLLHQGEAGIFSRYNPAKKLYSLGANSVPGFSNLLTKKPYGGKIATTANSVISAFPAQGAFSALILGKLNVGMLAVRSLLGELAQAYNSVKRHGQLMAVLQKYNDNLALAYYHCNPNAFEQPPPGVGPAEALDPVMPAAKVIIGEFKQGGGEIPDSISPQWMQSDLSRLLRKTYDFPTEFDAAEYDFFKHILSLPAELQGQIYKTNLNILQGLGIRLAGMVDDTAAEIYMLQDGLDESLENLCAGEYCFVEKFALLTELLESGVTSVPVPELVGIVRFTAGAASSMLKNYATVVGTPYWQKSPGLNKLSTFLSGERASEAQEQEKEEQKSSPITAGIDMDAVRRELSGSPGKILTYCGIPANEAQSVVADLKTFAAMQNPLDSGGDPRKLRRKISKTYWAAYEKAVFKWHENKGKVPKPVQLMLEFGYFDESLLDNEHIADLYNLTDQTKATACSALRAVEWLDVVANKKEVPSVDEMGLTYFEKLKAEHKDKGWKKESDVPEEYDTYELRTKYETANFLEVNVRLTSGSPATSFPILTRYQIILPLAKSFVTKERISEQVERLLAVDYSAFHREVLINDEERGILKEFVEMQVIPHFLIVPSIGTRLMMWQDVSGRSKASRGRISVPNFAMADLFTLLVEATGAFRWELTKTIMGPDWNNVSQSSITADYTDYVQFFKKNRDLSVEAKEKLAAELKRFRSDRDRFVNDYANWIRFEAEGVLKLNKVSRAIFYRHTPFAKSIRDGLESQPAYAELQNRFKNIRLKKLRELEVRYRKYGDVLPEELQANLDYHKV